MTEDTTPPTHGYSGKQLYQKLGLKPGMTCLTIGAPAHYEQLVAGAEGVVFLKRAKTADLVHLFCPNRRILITKVETALSKVTIDGMLWVSWPKKSSAMFRDLTEDQLREIILPLDWVDVKVCAVDGDWSGLKFVRRRTPRVLSG